MTETESMPVARRSASRNILTVMGGTLASRILGMLRNALFNRVFSTELTDAFGLAYRIPNLFRELLAEGALTNSIIPVYKSLPASERKAFASSLTGVLLAVNIVLVGLGVLLAPFVVGLRMASDSNVNYALAVYLTQLVWPFLTGISFSALAMALLNAEEKFAATSFSPLAFSVISIIGFLLINWLSPNNATWLALVTVLGGFAQFFVQIPSLRKYGLMPRLEFRMHPGLKTALGNMVPFTFTTGTREFLTIVLSTILTSFPAGANTGFYNADQVFLLVLGLFAVSPAMASYPRLSEHAAAQDWGAFRTLVSSNARLILFLTAFAAAAIFVLPNAVASAFYEVAGRITDDKFLFTAAALPPLALAALPWGLNQFLVRTLYSLQRTRDAILINVTGFLLNTALYFALSRGSLPAGSSPALVLQDALHRYALMNYATVIAGVLIVGLYFWRLSRLVGFADKKLVGHTVKVFSAALVAGAAMYAVDRLIPSTRGFVNGAIHVVVAGGVGGAVYLGLCIAMRVQEVQSLTKRFSRR
jgi:putative peptidoglycan lipid II flippase